MTVPHPITGREAMSEIPTIFQTACGIVMRAKSLKSMSRHTDVVDAIADELADEREYSAQFAESYAKHCRTDEGRQVCAEIGAQIRAGMHIKYGVEA